MSALQDFASPQIMTRSAPSGPVDSKHHRRVAANPSEVHIVTQVEYVNGLPVSRAVGAYWDHGTAVAVAATLGGRISSLEIGHIPQINLKDIH